jgi:hypothetical protein
MRVPLVTALGAACSTVEGATVPMHKDNSEALVGNFEIDGGDA